MKLRVRLSKWLSPLKDWEKVVQKMKKVGTAIKKRGGNFCSRVKMVNTYLTPCIGYLVRFKLILKSVTSLMWKSLCSALGVYANTKTSVLTLCYPLWTQSLSSKVVFGQTTCVAYTNMSQMISIEIKDLYVGEGRAECVVYNLTHAIKS